MGAKKKDAESQKDAKPAAPLAAEKLKSKEYERALAEPAGRIGETAGMGRGKGSEGLRRSSREETGRARAASSRRSDERVSPRVFRVVALPAPTEREKSQMYLQRYMRHFPAAGEIVMFDRS